MVARVLCCAVVTHGFPFLLSVSQTQKHLCCCTAWSCSPSTTTSPSATDLQGGPAFPSSPAAALWSTGGRKASYPQAPIPVPPARRSLLKTKSRTVDAPVSPLRNEEPKALPHLGQPTEEFKMKEKTVARFTFPRLRGFCSFLCVQSEGSGGERCHTCSRLTRLF